MNHFAPLRSRYSPSATAAAAVDPALLKLVMPDAKILSGIQVDQSAASPFGQYVLSQMQPDSRIPEVHHLHRLRSRTRSA